MTVRSMLGRVLRNVGTPTASTDAVTLGYLQGNVHRATAPTAIGTGATDIAGLAGSVVSGGTYKFRAVIPLVNVGGPTNINFGVAGPTASSIVYSVKRLVAPASAVQGADVYVAVTDAAAGTAVVPTHAEIEGTFVATSTATFKIRGIRVAGTSSTVQVGAYLELVRIA